MSGGIRDDDQVEITPAMLADGVKALCEWSWGAEDWDVGARAVYVAMAKASQRSPMEVCQPRLRRALTSASPEYQRFALETRRRRRVESRSRQYLERALWSVAESLIQMAARLQK